MATEQSQKLITVTPKAAEKIKEFMKEEKENPEYLRVYVQGGGCSGLSYGMGFETKPAELLTTLKSIIIFKMKL